MPTLTSDNKDDWFSLMRLYLESKDIWRIVSRSTSILTPISTELLSPFPAGFGDRSLEAGAKLAILQCLDQDDREIVRDLPTSGAIWQSLQSKYSDSLQVTNRQLHAKYVTFQKDPEKSIDATIGEINTMAKKLVGFNPIIALLATREYRFSILLHSLPREDYRTNIDTFDSQSNLNLDHAMKVLREKEASLQAEESANWAKNRSSRPTAQQQGSRPSLREGKSRLYRREQSSDDETPKCYLCHGSGHVVRNCPHAEDFRRGLKAKSKLKKEKERKNKDKHKDKGKGKSSKKGYRAFAAGSSLEDDSTSSSEDNEEEEVGYETAALSKELAGKPSSFVAFWVADSGALSYMTDQLQLFRQPIIPIKRRVIKVGGGRLYAD